MTATDIISRSDGAIHSESGNLCDQRNDLLILDPCCLCEQWNSCGRQGICLCSNVALSTINSFSSASNASDLSAGGSGASVVAATGGLRSSSDATAGDSSSSGRDFINLSLRAGLQHCRQSLEDSCVC